MKCRVLKPFIYSATGVGVEALDPGAELTVRADLVDGLCKAGFIEILAAGPTRAPRDPPPRDPSEGDDTVVDVAVEQTRPAKGARSR